MLLCLLVALVLVSHIISLSSPCSFLAPLRFILLFTLYIHTLQHSTTQDLLLSLCPTHPRTLLSLRHLQSSFEGLEELVFGRGVQLALTHQPLVVLWVDGWVGGWVDGWVGG